MTDTVYSNSAEAVQRMILRNYSIRIISISLLCFLFCFFTKELNGQNLITLQHTIDAATDSSVQMLNARSKHLQGEWEYHNFKVHHLPSLTLKTSPAAYNRVFVRRYDSESNIDIYREQQSLYSYGNLSIQQNFGLTGGRFFVDTELGFIRNFGGVSPYSQFSSVPFRIGYSQSLFGFNPYKWEKQTAPVKYDKVQKELRHAAAAAAEKAADVFFELAVSQAAFESAGQQSANADALYKIGNERHGLGLLSKGDLLALKLQTLNAETALERAGLNRKWQYMNYCNFLRIDAGEINFQVQLPTEITQAAVSVDLAVQSALLNNPAFPEMKEKALSAQRDLEQAKRARRFSADVSASFGFNQVANTLTAAYTRPLQQNMAAVNLTIPILDWGVGKGKVAAADENLKVITAGNQQAENAIIQEVVVSVSELNLFRSHIAAAKEAKEIADEAYSTTRELFIIGKADVSSLNLAVSGQMEAQNGYIQALRNYWSSYYKVRRLTGE